MNIQGVGLGFPPVGSGDLCNNRSTPAGPVQIFEYPLSERTSSVRGAGLRHQGFATALVGLILRSSLQ